MARHRVVPVTLDGVTYTLRWDYNTLQTIEELTGRSPLAGELVLDARGIVAVLYAGMDASARVAGKSSPLTRDEIGQALNPEDAEQINPLLAAIYRLIGANMPDALKEALEKSAHPREAPATSSASPSPGATRSDESISDSPIAISGV